MSSSDRFPRKTNKEKTMHHSLEQMESSDPVRPYPKIGWIGGLLPVGCAWPNAKHDLPTPPPTHPPTPPTPPPPLSWCEGIKRSLASWGVPFILVTKSKTAPKTPRNPEKPRETPPPLVAVSLRETQEDGQGIGCVDLVPMQVQGLEIHLRSGWTFWENFHLDPEKKEKRRKDRSSSDHLLSKPTNKNGLKRKWRKKKKKKKKKRMDSPGCGSKRCDQTGTLENGTNNENLRFALALVTLELCNFEPHPPRSI